MGGRVGAWVAGEENLLHKEALLGEGRLDRRFSIHNIIALPTGTSANGIVYLFRSKLLAYQLASA